MDWYVLWDYRWSLLNGLTFTIWLSAVSIVGSTIVGVVVGCLGTLPSFFLRRATGVYVETLRNLPVVVKRPGGPHGALKIARSSRRPVSRRG